MNKQILEAIYGPKCSSDNAFTSRARFLQSWYRVNVLKQNDFGFGPEENSTTKYGNILVDGQKTGMNFLSMEIFKYAQFRTQFLKSGETIKEYRLYNNMLSSQPMCFNLFYPIKKLFEQDYKRASKLIRACFPSLQIKKVLAVEIEYLPYPVSEYLNDRTAFDAMLIYIAENGERNVLVIETKYVEKLGTNPSSNLIKQMDLVKSSNLFNERGKMGVLKGFGQLGRNFLLAEKFRIENRLDKAFAVVLSPKKNDSSINEIKDFHLMMNEDFYDRLFYTSLESIVDQINNGVPPSLVNWIEAFKSRYLNFDVCNFIDIEGIKN